MEFHIARSLREKLDLNGVLFSYTGNVVFANVAAARRVAAGLNGLRGTADGGAGAVNGGALFAMGLIDELSHAMMARYRKEIDPNVLTEAVAWFEQRLGKPQVDKLLLGFAERFPGTEVYARKYTAAEWLKRTTEDLPHRESELEELMMLWLANQNPAFATFREMFADDELKQQTAYPKLTAGLPDYFVTRPPVSKEAGTLFEALRAPMLASPDSLVGQLEFIRENWSPYLGEELKRTLLAIDVVREEDVAIWMQFHPNTGGLHPTHGGDGWAAHGYDGDEYVGWEDEYVTGADGVRRRKFYATDHQAPLVEYEAFSQDHAWMPTVVMMAKSTYVWLEQLSKKYLRHIHRLDQIPDEELRLLADRGMTALWLIGLWERSVASKTIKRLRGQADAVASAYSLKEYNIADDLGGNAAYERLRDRAAAYGLRLASDMVPNHMGIDSPWVIEHPEWFVTRKESPFPVYRFDGPDLSTDSRAEIKLEDHYYDQTDAAVAFRLRTYRDNQTQFMYHGNDGTTFAWNDTAQLDYSKAYVREHVMQTILHVARLFPIIRFDAAMVLAKRHVQRLWFPLPGVGGSIPSRAENSMSQEEFDALMPNEFWREVVDRVAVEVPGTLLLAEAFWLLEGYFVRTLGMHRVYNSAFMNMIRDEENAKYRSYLKKTVEFDPDILKRYVNFMSNPDEKTAAEQFGDGDKYFGTCTLLATLPGLPMFAHGQIEGFSERYGMDFKEARLQETPNESLIARYYREITPLLKNRKLFAESTHFVLYDFWNEHGTVDENVMAYSNRLDNERAVILYNNVYASTRGTIHISAASMDKGSGQMRQRSLTEALALPGDDALYVAYRDANSGLEYLRRGADLRDHGLSVELRGYQYVVLQQWRELWSSAEWPWAHLCETLQGAGVQSLDEALSALRLKPLHDALREVVSYSNLESFIETVQVEATVSAEEEKERAKASKTGPKIDLSDTFGGAKIYLQDIKNISIRDIDSVPPSKTTQAADPGMEEAVSKAVAEFSAPVGTVNALEALAGFVAAGEAFAGKVAEFFAVPESAYAARLHEVAASVMRFSVVKGESPALWAVSSRRVLPSAYRSDDSVRLWGPVLVWMALQALPTKVNRAEVFDQLRLRSALGPIFASLGLYGDDSWRAAARVRILLAQGGSLFEAVRTAEFWNDADVQWLVGKTESGGLTYFNKESLEELLSWMQLLEVTKVSRAEADTRRVELQKIADAAEESGYRLDAFRRLLEKRPGASLTV